MCILGSQGDATVCHRVDGHAGAVILEAEHAIGTQIHRRTGAIAIGIGHGLHQGQHALAQGQCHAVIRIGGVAVPDVVQQGQGHFPGARVDSQSEVVHPTGAAGDDVAHLIEHDGGTLAVGRGRIDRIQAARHVGAGQRQAVANAARPVSPEGRVELGLYIGGAQGGTGHPVSASTAQADQAFIHGHRIQFFRIGSKGDAGNIIQNDHIQAAAGIVTISINQYDAETLTKRIIIGRLGMGFTPSQGVAVVHATSAGHGIVINAGNDQLITKWAGNGLREGCNSLPIGDQSDASQRQTLHTIGCTEGKSTDLSHSGGIRITPSCQ